MTLDKMKVFCKRFIIMFLDLNDNKIDYIERLKKFMFYSILTKTESGSFENVSAIRSCVTVATKEYALMAAHCLPVDILEQFKFAIYNQDDKPHIVRIECINRNLDFAVLKTVEKEFEKYPNGLAFPDTGIKYTLLVSIFILCHFFIIGDNALIF